VNRQEILNLANDAQPELMDKVAKALVCIESFEPAFLTETLEEMKSITDFTQEKVAASKAQAFTEAAKRGGKYVAGTLAASVALGLGGAIATDLFDAARRGLTKSRNFKRIMAANPDLKEKVDPKRLQLAFNALHRYAPDFTADPLVGGSALYSMATMPEGNEYNLVSSLIESRNKHLDAKGKAFRPAQLPNHNPFEIMTAAEQMRHDLEKDKLQHMKDVQFDANERYEREQQIRKGLEEKKIEVDNTRMWADAAKAQMQQEQHKSRMKLEKAKLQEQKKRNSTPRNRP
jgi:hypothetical protein